MDCKSCTYFKKNKDLSKSGVVVVGFCDLRQKHISEETITLEQCKDRAILIMSERGKEQAETEDDFVKRVAFG